jgi:homoserine dehydrogenase
MRKTVNLGLIGFGVVGSGTAQILRQHRAAIAERVGARLNLLWVCSRTHKASKWIDTNTRQTTNWRQVVNDPRVDCVVELIGGTHPAREIVTRSIENGKHVVTANKSLLAKHWDEVFGLARKEGKLIYFEAAVGGGVPLVQALNEGLAANAINKITGILNGTTNFILTKMQDAGLTFEEALKLAQEAGFAEADPKFDVEGIDAAQKLSILASIATGQWVAPSKIFCEGITKLQAIDLKLIQERLHSTIKLLGIAEKMPEGWTFRVHPTLIPNTHPFANVRNEYNAVSFQGDAAGNVMLYGKGAGRLPTSSAVVSDIIFLTRQIANGTAGELPYVVSSRPGSVRFAPISAIKTRYYLRVNTLDKPGTLANITSILGRHGVSIAAVYQDTFQEEYTNRTLPIILLTHRCTEEDLRASVDEINKMRQVRFKTVVIRME